MNRPHADRRSSDKRQAADEDSAPTDTVGILDSIDLPIVIADRDCTMVRCNRAAAESLTLAHTDVGRRLNTIGALADIAEIETICTQVVADEVPCRHDVSSGDRRFLLRVAPYWNRAGQVEGTVLAFTNVTAFRASLEQAVYEREYTKTILNTVANPLVVLDSQLRVRSGNRAFYSMFGVSRERAQGIPLRALGSEDWKTSGLWASLNVILADSDDFAPLEVQVEFPEIGRRTILVDARRVSGEGDGTILLAIQDISERKRTEEKLQESDRRKDEFLAMLAHELRNPLAPIRTGLEVLRLSDDASQSVQRVRSMMERQVGQMVRLIDDLLDVSRIASGKIVLQRAPWSVAELIERAIEAQRVAIEAAKIDFVVDSPLHDCIINVDPARFVQILSNVLNNASKFTPADGQIRCSAEPRAVAGVPHVAITISDTGVGISRDMLPKVFEMFVQAEPATERAHGGLGIGLALAKRLIEMHGGDITARSAGPGHGSTFVITMPVSDTQVIRAQPSRQDAMSRVTSRVVIVDDNRDAAITMSMLVEQLGGSAQIAHDAVSGVQAVMDFQPDVVFLDIGMPGIDGYEACRRMRQQPLQKDVFIVAVTGWGQPHDKQRAFDAGFDAHLTKPVDPAILMRVLTGAASAANKGVEPN